MPRNKEVTALLKIAVKQGFTWSTTAKGHYQVRSPEGRVVAITASTPSDHRGIKNFRADLRRGGVAAV